MPSIHLFASFNFFPYLKTLSSNFMEKNNLLSYTDCMKIKLYFTVVRFNPLITISIMLFGLDCLHRWLYFNAEREKRILDLT
jgi:hypothetical protein